jgi:cobalt-zinc-cadmium efflux system outer membrane protein
MNPHSTNGCRNTRGAVAEPLSIALSVDRQLKSDASVGRMVRIAAVLLIGLCTFAGCARFEAKPLSPERTAADFEARTLDDPNLKAFVQANLKDAVTTWPPREWDFHTLTLVALFYHPSLDVARAQWAVAKGQEQAAAERPNPTLGVSPAYNSTTGNNASISPWIVGATLDVPIETAGKRDYRVAQARQLSEAARLQVAQTAWELRHQVREALLDLYAATQTEALLSRQRDLQEENVGLLEQLNELGEVSANELGQARVMRDQTHLTWLDAGAQRAQAGARLASSMGVPAKALESTELSFDVFETLPDDVPPAEAQRRALLNRADLLAALADYQASQSALQGEVARQFPDIQLGPGYEYDQSENKWMLGLSVTLPVLNQNQGAIAAAEARRAEAAAKVKTLQARIIGDLEQAVTSYRMSLVKLQTAETLVSELEATMDRFNKMYEAGEVVRSEVVATALELYSGTLNRLEARVEALKALGRIEDAMHVAPDLPNGSEQISVGRSEPLRDQDHE